MARTRYISTTTSINYNDNNEVDIVLNYAGESASCQNNIPHIKQGKIAFAPLNVNGVAIKEGELYLNLACYPDYIQTTMDQEGRLLITVYDDRETGYSLDPDTGNLTFELQS